MAWLNLGLLLAIVAGLRLIGDLGPVLLLAFVFLGMFFVVTRASGWVALFYYSAGVALLWMARGPEPLQPWWVGGTFGSGQLMAALVLYWNLERPTLLAIEENNDDQEED